MKNLTDLKILFSTVVHSPGRLLVITIGNQYRGDDGIGPYIAQNIELNNRFHLLNAGDKPENILFGALDYKPGYVLIIDAAHFSGRPGEIRIFTMDQIPDTMLSTHSFSPAIIAGFLKHELNCQVFFAGIQAVNLDFGTQLSPRVKKSGDQFIQWLAEL